MRNLVVLALIAGSCASSQPFGPVGEQFRHRVPYEIGRTEVVAGNAITIEEVWGTRPAIEVGGSYVVTGTYLLAADSGELIFWQTAKNRDNTGPNIDTQSIRVPRGEGRFALLHDVPGPGYFHLVLVAEDGREVADVYFGHGETLLQ